MRRGRGKQFALRTYSILMALLMLFSLVSPGLVQAQSENGLYTSVSESNQSPVEKISSQLASEFKDVERVSFIIKFKEKAETLKVADEAVKNAEKANLSSFKQEYVKRSAVISELKATAHQSQNNVREYLEQEVENGNAENIRAFHIVNGIAVTATKEVVEKVAAFEEVEEILPNERIELIPTEESESTASTSDLDEIEWNVEQVNAPDVWDMGIDGSGVVVAVIDSGVDFNHSALKEKYRGYKTETGEVDHTYSWYDAYGTRATPYDDNGHGTHVAGTILGSEPNGTNKIGVAPGAQWIGVKAFDSNGRGWSTDALEAAEWILAPGGDVTKAPDIVNNSWSFGAGKNELFREAVVAWRAAGIFPEFSAGNDGPRTIAFPANYPESFATAALDNNNSLAWFSSTGPGPYGEIKPDISAPGVNIRSAIPGGGYGMKSGTSMAAPAVSGVVALMLSSNSDLSIDQIEQIIMDTATPLTNASYPNTPNEGFGYGLINAYEAVSTVMDTSRVEGKVTDNSSKSLSAKVSVLETERSVNTNPADGTYSLPHKPGTYTIVAEAYGYQPREQTVTLKEDQTAKVDFTLVENSKGQVSGKVINQRTGEVIEGATLYLGEDANVEPVQTNAEGGYTLQAYEGTYTLKVVASGFTAQDIEVTVKGNVELNIELEPFYTIPGGEIGYDDGTAEEASAYYYPGNGWAVKMSLAEGKEYAIVKEGVFQFWDANWPYPGGTEFAIEVWDASGPNGEPGKKLAGPIEATAKRDLNQWTVVDLRDHKIEVTGDFYMVYVQTDIYEYSPGLASDRNSWYTGRTYNFIGGTFSPTAVEDGNYMIRARVDYQSDAPPVITAPKEGLLTNKKEITIKGKAASGDNIQIMNNGVNTATGKADSKGEFSISTKLQEGKNDIKAVSQHTGSESDSVSVTLDTTAPVVTIDAPQEGTETNKATVSIEGTVKDAHLDSVKVNGEKASVSNGKYSKSVSLKNGKNEITVIATDKLGNASQAKRVVVRDTTVPAAPTVNAVTNQSLKIIGKAELGTRLSAKVSGKEIGTATAKSDGTFEVKIAKQKADTEISVTATDKAGNVSKATKIKVRAQLERISGSSRYNTAIQVSQSGWDSAETVIIARGDDFADALAGVPLAHKLDAPILMTLNDRLLDTTLTEIKRLGAKNVVILGGEGAVSKKVANELKKSGLDVRRISGSSRFETAALIASEVAPKGTSKVVVASGMDFPDALSVASHAAKEGLPILLTLDQKLPAATEAKVKGLGVKETIVVGGKSVVSEKVKTQLPKSTRLSGKDRYGTNTAIAEHFGVESKHLYVATGQNYADALTGAVLAAKDDSTILLVHHKVPSSVSNYLTKHNADSMFIFGGEGAVSKSVENELRKLLK